MIITKINENYFPVVMSEKYLHLVWEKLKNSFKLNYWRAKYTLHQQIMHLEVIESMYSKFCICDMNAWAWDNLF